MAAIAGTTSASEDTLQLMLGSYSIIGDQALAIAKGMFSGESLKNC